jgi:hypothetical protein
MSKHTVSVFQRPNEGENFLGGYEAFNYRHKISAVGGFDTASFDVAVYPLDADFWFDRLGCAVKIYIDNPAQPAWEGFINRVNVAIGALTYTSSLDELANRVSVTYSAPDVAANPRNTTAVNNTDSQAIFGVKEGALDGYLIEGTTVTKFTSLQAMVLNNQAYPQKSTIFNPQGQETGLLNVECLGWYHTLNWVKWLSTAGAAAVNANVVLTNILATYPNTSFFSVSDTSLVSANPAFAQRVDSRVNQTYWEMFQSVQEAGDGSSRWVMGITPLSEQLGYRRFYYRLEDVNTRQYILRASDGRVRSRYGQLVEPWRVQPDATARVADYAVAWNKPVGDNPTEFYVDTVDYDANAQSVQFGSTDNITAEGALNLRRYFKTTGRRFGAPQRRAWS